MPLCVSTWFADHIRDVTSREQTRAGQEQPGERVHAGELYIRERMEIAPRAFEGTTRLTVFGNPVRVHQAEV